MQEALQTPPKALTANHQFCQDVIAGLTHSKKYLQPKYFYDKQGSAYFDQICDLSEYYPYTAEISLLPKVAEDLAQKIKTEHAIVEFGAGSLQKIKPLLNRVKAITTFIPIDISGEHLTAACRELTKEYSQLKVTPIVADFTRPVFIGHNQQQQKLGFFPGSTIGNFTPMEAQRFLSNAKSTLGQRSRLLIGVDTKKSPQVLHRAYNDSKGITAKFNLNILERINREMNSNIEIQNFEHYACYNAEKGCIEMHLICTKKHSTNIEGVPIHFKNGESIHTESSYKYAPDEFTQLAKRAGWQLEEQWLAKDDLFSVYLLC